MAMLLSEHVCLGAEDLFLVMTTISMGMGGKHELALAPQKKSAGLGMCFLVAEA